MNTSATNKNDAIVPAMETEKSGNTLSDIESQRCTLALDSPSNSSAHSGDRLVGGGDAPTCDFIEHAPPTFKETAACVVFCVVLVTLTGVSMWFAEPNQRPIPSQYLESSGEYVMNMTNGEVYKGESINTIALLLICIFCPFCIQATYGFTRGRPGDFYRTINTYCVAFPLTGIVSECIKIYVGYLRPIFFDQCNPDESYETCQGRYEDADHFEVNELSKSFISGHASLAFCGGVLFCLFLERTIGVSSVEVAVAHQLPQQSAALVSRAYRKPPALRRLGSIFALLPMAVSIWVACSRVVDNVHFPADVVGGAVLGASIAAYCHPLWYTDPRYLP